MQRACEMVQSLLKTQAAQQRTPYHPLCCQILQLMQKDNDWRGCVPTCDFQMHRTSHLPWNRCLCGSAGALGTRPLRLPKLMTSLWRCFARWSLHSAVFVTLSQGLRTQPCSLNGQACPGSPVDWDHHSSCMESRRFHNPCSHVQEEIEKRIAKNADRKKLPGTYELLATQSGSCSKGSRATSPYAVPGPFTDLFGFIYEAPVGESQQCLLTSCSESQVPSLCDFSTNFCNLFNLFCNEMDGCETLAHDLSYDAPLVGSNCNHGPKCGGWETNQTQCSRR
eukprot:symbB.v1.2.020180.t1/scaffold1684.1/size105940/3